MNEKLQRYLGYLNQDETNASLLLSTTRMLHHLEQLDEAIALITRLAHHHDSNAEIAGLLALLHFDNQNAELATFYSNKALVLNPDNSEGQLVGILLSALNHQANPSEIEALLEKNPNESRLLFALGTTHMHHMNLPDAEKAFLRAIEFAPNFYELWLSMGMCYALQNKLDKAEQAYQQAITIHPNTADGHNGITLLNALRMNLNCTLD